MTNIFLPKPFTVALLADIHGNVDALHAVLADLAACSYDHMVIAGDLVTQGPYPAETLARVRALQAPTIFGNGDRAVVDAPPHNRIVWWTRQQIGESGRSYLASLPFSYRITPSDGHSPETDLLIVHATPTSVNDVLTLEPHPLGTTHIQKTPEDEAKRMLGETRANLIVYGHIHYASSGMIGEQRLVSIGSVGFPFDGNQQAAYALAAWDGRQWQVTHHRVSYNYERVIAAIYQSGQPDAETYAQRLRQANWCP